MRYLRGHETVYARRIEEGYRVQAMTKPREVYLVRGDSGQSGALETPARVIPRH